MDLCDFYEPGNSAIMKLLLRRTLVHQSLEWRRASAAARPETQSQQIAFFLAKG